MIKNLLLTLTIYVLFWVFILKKGVSPDKPKGELKKGATELYIHYGWHSVLLSPVFLRIRPLYIGITNQGTENRFKQHKSKKIWPYFVLWKTVKTYRTRSRAEKMEKHYIKRLKPFHNIAHNN